ncbi:hypothetical protein [Achromobacter sp. Bel]|uniref:hypothetical protein n=1 Tax=Achromobacter sp. Bel TaxID=2727415 RepID=UPI00145E80A5|nr:hypothetical protein [Achromobacter sp. Bel]NMK47017.1 hypothetical protein [Achromobacter sp. Bel]
MQIDNFAVPSGNEDFHTVIVEMRDVIRLVFPSGALLTIAASADAAIFQRFERDHDSMVAINAPMARADKSRPTVVMSAPNVISQQLGPWGFEM